MAGAKKGEKEARLLRSSCRYALPRPSLVEFRSDLRSWRVYSRVSAPVFAASFPLHDRVPSSRRDFSINLQILAWRICPSPLVRQDRELVTGLIITKRRVESVRTGTRPPRGVKKWCGRSLGWEGDEEIELDGETLKDSIEFGDCRCNEGDRGDEFADRSVLRERRMLRLRGGAA